MSKELEEGTTLQLDFSKLAKAAAAVALFEWQRQMIKKHL